MHIHDEIKEIIECLEQRRLGCAIEKLENFGFKFPDLNFSSEIEVLHEDYKLMAGYWSRGYKDPLLEEQYSSLLRRAYLIASDVALRYSISRSSFLLPVSKRVNHVHHKWTISTLQSELENFVTEVAMLEFESEKVRHTKELELYREHQTLLSDVFDYIWLSSQWKEGTADVFRNILLSPTVDSIAQQMIVSAIMLSCMNFFDMEKFRLLIDAYRKSCDEYVKQRALIGWVFSIGKNRYLLYPEQKELIVELLKDKTICEELLELQMQITYCANAERDNHTIQREIMPDLLKHNNFNITLNGIEEKDDDPMQDVFDPGASERNMEKVEEGFRKMIDMQKEGRDIYFGGFSQMKRYPFFDNISNWFVPYYENHPAVGGVKEKMANIKMLSNMLSSGTFCNSDKYSFLLAFAQIVDRLPKNIAEMLNQGEMAAGAMITSEEQISPTYIRRIYLQDLYRFFRIYPQRSLFYNPFSYKDNSDWISEYIFFSNNVFKGSNLEEYSCKAAAFMLKKQMYSEAAEVLSGIVTLTDNYTFNLLCGNIMLHSKEIILNRHFENSSAVTFFEKALNAKPESEKALTGLARALFYEGEYALAHDVYIKLLNLKPDNNSLILSYCICLVNLTAYDKALEKLYKLHYDLPENMHVSRVLARALTGAGKYEQAKELYIKLEHDVDLEDILNHGYCEWFAGNVQAAVNLFVAYLRKQYPNVMVAGSLYNNAYNDIIKPEIDFIKTHGITETEMQMMVDMICGAL